MEDEDETIYVRVRRDKTTSFFICQSYESVDSIKRRLCQYHRNVDPADIRLYYVNKLLDDKSTIHDQGIVNNCLIYYRLKKPNTTEWEQLPELVI